MFGDRKKQKSWQRYKNPKILKPTPRIRTNHNRLVLLWRVIGLFLIAGAVTWVLFFSDIFIIKQIDIIGEVNAQIRSNINQFYGRNIITQKTAVLKQLAADDAGIKDIIVYKGFPNTLRVEVVLYKPAFIWISGENKYFISPEGVAFFGGDQTKIDALPTIIDPFAIPVEPGRPLVTQSYVKFFLDLVDALENHLPIDIKSFKARASSYEIEAILADGRQVLFDTNREVEPQVKSLIKVLASFGNEIKEYMDLRIAGKAFVK